MWVRRRSNYRIPRGVTERPGRGAGPWGLQAWTTDPYDAGGLPAAGGRAVLEVMLRKAAHALAVVRGVRDPNAEGNRNDNKRFVALATEIGPAGPERPEKVVGWSDCPTRAVTRCCPGA